MDDAEPTPDDDLDALRRKSGRLSDEALELRRQIAAIEQQIREKITRVDRRPGDREWQTYDGKRIVGRAAELYFGATLRKSEVVIDQADGTRWPLLVDDLSTDDIKWIVARLGNRPVTPGGSISLSEDEAAG